MPNVDDITSHLLAQDVVWVLGGSVAGLLAMWRLHGVDAALHAAWLAGVALDQADGRRVVLSVLAVNHRAYRLYHRLGFTEISRDGVAPEVRIRTAVGP